MQTEFGIHHRLESCGIFKIEAKNYLTSSENNVLHFGQNWSDQWAKSELLTSKTIELFVEKVTSWL